MSSQLDMFSLHMPPRKADRETKRGPRVLHTTDSEEAWVKKLEDTGRYRILRKLLPRPVVERAASPFPRVGVLVDTETTGLDPTRDEIIEIGMVAFTYDDDGRLGDVVGVFSALRQPYSPIPPEITKLTGITDEMVAGKTISIDAIEAFIAPADLIIAHNARFDRPFCECLAPGFGVKAWACSLSEIKWSDRGFEGTKLGYLVGQSGYFHEGHRAVDDCHALFEILARPCRDVSDTYFTELLRNSERKCIRIWAVNSPFDMKDKLKARGYRWSDGSDGQPKAWWTEIAEEDSTDELRYLQTEIYQWPDADPPTQSLTALDRFKSAGSNLKK
jgi:DNA polymerase III subunit epsilon